MRNRWPATWHCAAAGRHRTAASASVCAVVHRRAFLLSACWCVSTALMHRCAGAAAMRAWRWATGMRRPAQHSVATNENEWQRGRCSMSLRGSRPICACIVVDRIGTVVHQPHGHGHHRGTCACMHSPCDGTTVPPSSACASRLLDAQANITQCHTFVSTYHINMCCSVANDDSSIFPVLSV